MRRAGKDGKLPNGGGRVAFPKKLGVAKSEDTRLPKVSGQSNATRKRPLYCTLTSTCLITLQHYTTAAESRALSSTVNVVRSPDGLPPDIFGVLQLAERCSARDMAQ